MAPRVKRKRWKASWETRPGLHLDIFPGGWSPRIFRKRERKTALGELQIGNGLADGNRQCGCRLAAGGIGDGELDLIAAGESGRPCDHTIGEGQAGRKISRKRKNKT